MITGWRVSLELGRDDGGSLSDEGVDQLTELLTQDGVRPAVTHRDDGAVLVQMTVDATNEMAARSAAESELRGRAGPVWTALGLPPFTIAFVQIEPEGDR